MTQQPDRIKYVKDAFENGGVVDTDNFKLYHNLILGERMTFCGNMRRDPIQRTHRKGQFYEQDELELLGKLIPSNAVIVDIGANIGNHTLFFSRILKAKRVIPFEPNPLAYNVLLAHIMVNNVVDIVDVSNLGLGLSDVSADGFGMEKRDRNLGAASMVEGDGDISVVRGDEALAGTDPDFIKVDVEGMELGVLAGLGDIPSRTKCLMYVEVDNENEAGFLEWRDSQSLETIHEIKRYRTSNYHLIVHRDRAPALRKKLKTLLNEEKDA